MNSLSVKCWTHFLTRMLVSLLNDVQLIQRYSCYWIEIFFQVSSLLSPAPTPLALILPSAAMDGLMLFGYRLHWAFSWTWEDRCLLWETPDSLCMITLSLQTRQNKVSFGQCSSSFENSAMVASVFSLWLLFLLEYNAPFLPLQP